MSSAQPVTWNVICGYAECNQRGKRRNFTDGEFCSTEHKHRELGRPVVEAIRRDHRVCASCHRVLKTVEEPPDYYRRKWTKVISDAVVGFEHPTEDLHVQGGNRYCTCSNVDPGADIDFCKTADLRSTLANLLAVVHQHREEDKHDKRVDPDELLDALKEQSQEGDLDWELAIGRAVE